jgi:type II secretory pathway component PulL
MKQTYFQRARMIICLLLVWLVASSSVIAQEFKTVRDGIEYAELTRTISGLPVRNESAPPRSEKSTA